MTEAPIKERAYKVIPREDLHPEAWEYSDGSVRRPGSHGTGAVWVAKPPGAAVTIDKTRSQVLHDRKAALRDAEQQDTKDEIQRALVDKVAGARTPAGAVGAWIGHLASEMDDKTAPKEHGISNYVKVVKEVGQMAGLIEEKKADNRQVNIDTVNLSPGTEAHVREILGRLLPAGGDASRGAPVAPSVAGRQQDSEDEAEE